MADSGRETRNAGAGLVKVSDIWEDWQSLHRLTDHLLSRSPRV